MSVQISSLQVKTLAKNLRQTMTYGYLSQLLQEVVTNPDLVQRLESAIGKKKDKPIKQTSADKLVGSACGFDSYESAAGVRSTKYLESIGSDEVLLERLNAWTPPKNRVIFMEQNLPLFMKTFPSLTEHRAMQLLLSDYFLFFDKENMYLRTNVYESLDNDFSGIVELHSHDFNGDVSILGGLSTELFREDGVWVRIAECKNLPSSCISMLHTISAITGFLRSVTDTLISDADSWQLWCRLDGRYEASFQKLKRMCINDPLCSYMLEGEYLLEDKSEVFTDSAVHSLLMSAIGYTQEYSRFVLDWSSDQFLKWAAMTLVEFDDNKLRVSRRVNVSENERVELVKQGVLEEAPNGGDYPAWDVNYTITLTESHNIELSIEEQPSLYQWMVHVGYSKWKDGCAYPPRAAKIIWDDFNKFLPEIDGEMAITNQSEIISKMALLTINREG